MKERILALILKHLNLKPAGDFLARVGVDQSDGVISGGELGDSILDFEGVAEPVAVGEVGFKA